MLWCHHFELITMYCKKIIYKILARKDLKIEEALNHGINNLQHKQQDWHD